MFAKLTAVASVATALICANAWAHTTGHGAKIEGKGPNGGQLASIVLAKDAEKGASAETRGVAEILVHKKGLHLFLFGPDRKTAVKFPEGTTLKWIFVGSKLAEPQAVPITLKEATLEMHEHFDPETLRKAETIEVILPALGESAEKHVASWPIAR